MTAQAMEAGKEHRKPTPHPLSWWPHPDFKWRSIHRHVHGYCVLDLGRNPLQTKKLPPLVLPIQAVSGFEEEDLYLSHPGTGDRAAHRILMASRPQSAIDASGLLRSESDPTGDQASNLDRWKQTLERSLTGQVIPQSFGWSTVIDIWEKELTSEHRAAITALGEPAFSARGYLHVAAAVHVSTAEGGRRMAYAAVDRLAVRCYARVRITVTAEDIWA